MEITYNDSNFQKKQDFCNIFANFGISMAKNGHLLAACYHLPFIWVYLGNISFERHVIISSVVNYPKLYLISACLVSDDSENPRDLSYVKN